MSLRQKFEFARHIPPDQILRRIYLAGKRRLLDRGRPPSLRRWYGPDLNAIRSLGLHAPHGRLWRDEGIWSARFLNEKREIGPAIDWAGIGGNADDQLWRMNLHYFEFIPELKTSEVVELIDSWIECCRPKTRTASSAAWQPYTISLRISAWLDAWSSRGPFGDKVFRSRLAASLAEQAEHLARNLETDVRGNHLIKNIRALTEAARALGRAGEDWRITADRHLIRELNRQVLSDGIHYERSPSYHFQVFADLLATYANRSTDDALQSRLKSTLYQMAQAAADLTHPDGFVAQFGDSGLNMTVSPAACFDAFENLFGPPPSTRSRFAFPEGGFYGARNGDNYLIVRMGALGHDALMAHAHGDWGSFELSRGGQRVVVDQGVLRYSESVERQKARSTSSHNTAMLDGAEQAAFFGAFRCAERPHARPPCFEANDDGFILHGELSPATHPGRGSHQRKLVLSAQRVTIEDQVLAGQNLSVNILLHPSIIADQNHKRIDLSWPNNFKLTLQFEGCTPILEDAFWWPDMGQEIQTKRVVYSGKGTLRTVIT